MRKHILALLLLVPILLIPLVSCDGDILGSLSSFMGGVGGNALIDNQIVVVDTSQGAKIGDSAGTLKDLALPDAPIDPANLTEDEQAEKDAYDAAYTAEVKKIQDSLAEALAAKDGTKATKLKEDMDKPATSAPPQKVADAIVDIAADLGVDVVVETQGDLIAAILMVEALDKGQKIADKLADPDGVQPTDAEILEFVSEALQVIDVVKTISPTNGVSLDALISDLIGDDEFMNNLFRGSRAISRDGGEDDALTYIEPIFNMIIKAIGTDTGTGHIIPKGLTALTTNFAYMRKTYESVAPRLQGSSRELELTDVINYALSVVFTEANGFFSTVGSGLTFTEVLNDVIDWQDGGKVGEPDFIGDIPDWEAKFNSYMTDNQARFDKIELTLRQLIARVPNSQYLDDGLDELFK